MSNARLIQCVVVLKKRKIHFISKIKMKTNAHSVAFFITWRKCLHKSFVMVAKSLWLVILSNTITSRDALKFSMKWNLIMDMAEISRSMIIKKTFSLKENA